MRVSRDVGREGAEDWEAITEPLPSLLPYDPGVILSVGVDLATKSDCAAVVAVTRDDKQIRLAEHRIWTPRKGEPLDLEQTVEAYLLDLADRHRIRDVRFDPYQAARSAKTLLNAGLPMVEFPQTSANLTLATQNLYEAIKGQRIAVYPDEELRRHVLNAVAIESPRGWRLAKEKSSRKIDAAVALSFAALGGLNLPPPRSRKRLASGGGRDDAYLSRR